MKNPPVEDQATDMRLMKTSALLVVPAVLGIAFWFVTSSTGVAGPTPTPPNMCDVCHKNAATLTFACNSLEYRRHIDHGDPAHACNATRTDKGDKKELPGSR